MEKILKLLAFAAFVVSCNKQDRSPTTPAADATEQQRITLRVSLYPWVPSEVAFRSFIELDFERKNPDIDLVVLELKGEPAYDPEAASAYLREDVDLLEVDAMILGDIASKDVLTKPAIPERTWVPASIDAASIQGQPWGVPHWACGYFVITTKREVADATDLESFRDALAGSSAEIPVAGDMKGEWGTPMVYIDAYADFFPDIPVAQALADTANSEVIAGLREVAKFCTDEKGNNYCRGDDSKLFANGRTGAYFGYSERLNKVFLPGNKPNDVYIRPVPLGPNSTPVLFTDVVVQSKNCAEDCSRAAARFLEYYTADETYAEVLMSKDVGYDAVPRYLFPATMSAFDSSDVKDDSLYKQMRAVAGSAIAYPNSGVFDAVSGDDLARALWEKIWGDEYD